MKTKSSSSSMKVTLGIFLIVVALIMVLIQTILVKSTTKVTPVVVAVKPIRTGTVIKPEDVMTIEMGSYNVPQKVITNANQVIGRYAIRDIPAEELIFSSSITNDYVKRLSEKAKYGAMAMPIDMLETVAGDIKENDFVTILVSMRKSKDQESFGEQSSQLPEVGTALIYTKELAAVRVLGLYSGNGQKYEKGVTQGSPNMIVFDALPVQRVLLNQARDNGKIRITILPEYVQEGFRKAWGLSKLEPEEEENVENKIQQELESNEELEKEHMNMSEKDSIGTLVDKGEDDEDIIEGTSDDIMDISGDNENHSDNNSETDKENQGDSKKENHDDKKPKEDEDDDFFEDFSQEDNN